MPFKEKATDDQIREAYAELRSCRKVATRLGMCAQSVHERLVKLNITRVGGGRPWTPEEDALIRAEYSACRATGTVRDLAERMQREYFTLATRASYLGIGNGRLPKPWLRKIKDEQHARAIFDEFKQSPLGLLQFCAKRGIDAQTMNRHIANRWPDEWDAVIESKAPRQTKYRLGRAFEYQTRDLFRKHGYMVMRSPRSGSIVDLVAIRKGQTVLIQCKRSGAITSRDWNELYDVATSVGAVPLLAERPTGHGINLWVMTGRKDGRKSAQPRARFEW